jgi:hypothetical protein
MKSFSVKSIGLYSLAIGSAIVFFQFVTSYGEANIKAPSSVAGNYLIARQKLPGCLQNKALLLKLQQSGIYLSANLMVIDEPKGGDIPETIDRFSRRDAAPADPRPTFSGKLQTATRPNQLDLIGLMPTKACPPSSQLRMTGLIAANDARIYYRTPQLQGKLWLTSPDLNQALPVEFTGVRQKTIPSSTQSH